MDLRQPVNQIFDRIFNGNDIPVNGIKRVEYGVQCRRFSASRRTGDQYHAKRPFDRLFHDLHVFLGEPQPAQPDGQALSIQNTHDDLVSERYGKNGYAKINFLAANFQFKTPVLGHMDGGDVQPGHNLDTDCHRVLVFLRDLEDIP